MAVLLTVIGADPYIVPAALWPIRRAVYSCFEGCGATGRVEFVARIYGDCSAESFANGQT